MKQIIVITGQTATGKTHLALKYAERYQGEVVNCDSRQVYKNLDIVTGKDIGCFKFCKVKSINNFDIGYYQLPLQKLPNQKLKTTNYKLPTVRLWLYDIASPDQYFSSYDYKQCYLYLIKRLIDKNKTIVVVGGSYFYLKHLLYKINTETIPPDWQLRQSFTGKKTSELQKILRDLSTKTFSKLNQSDKNNPQRLIRRIEIIKSGRAIRLVKNSFNPEIKINQFIGLRYKDKAKLRLAIEKRVGERVKNGAIEEVKTLIKSGYKFSDPGLKTIGYQQIYQYLNKELSKKEALQLWITREMQYAKRQYTFMKKDPNIQWKDI